jgi:hypothetical protein
MDDGEDPAQWNIRQHKSPGFLFSNLKLSMQLLPCVVPSLMTTSGLHNENI